MDSRRSLYELNSHPAYQKTIRFVRDEKHEECLRQNAGSRTFMSVILSTFISFSLPFRDSMLSVRLGKKALTWVMSWIILYNSMQYTADVMCAAHLTLSQNEPSFSGSYEVEDKKRQAVTSFSPVDSDSYGTSYKTLTGETASKYGNGASYESPSATNNKMRFNRVVPYERRVDTEEFEEDLVSNVERKRRNIGGDKWD